MSNDDSITNGTGQVYDTVKSVYTNYTTSEDKTLITEKKKSVSKIEEFLLYLFDWKIVFAMLLVITLVTAVGFNKLFIHLKFTNNYSAYGLDLISFFQYGLIINMFIAVFTISFFFNIKKVNGIKGAKGGMGKRGQQGENTHCDICNIKPSRLKRNTKLEPTTIVDEPDNLQELKEKKTGWETSDIETNNYLNKNIMDCEKSVKNCKKSNNHNKNIRYLVGVIANLDISNQITTLQFIYKDQNNTIKFVPKTKKWGAKLSDNVNVKTIKAPDNCGVYKITSFIKNEKIVGLRLYYKHTLSNKKLDKKEETIGSTRGQQYSVEVLNDTITTKPYFLSDVNCIYNDDKVLSLIVAKKSINNDYN
tara:strand:- start:298 stop:1383 length:1086 start_codon:yes stop_codon:yes gene_type:complete